MWSFLSLHLMNSLNYKQMHTEEHQRISGLLGCCIQELILKFLQLFHILQIPVPTQVHSLQKTRNKNRLTNKKRGIHWIILQKQWQWVNIFNTITLERTPSPEHGASNKTLLLLSCPLSWGNLKENRKGKGKNTQSQIPHQKTPFPRRSPINPWSRM